MWETLHQNAGWVLSKMPILHVNWRTPFQREGACCAFWEPTHLLQQEGLARRKRQCHTAATKKTWPHETLVLVWSEFLRSCVRAWASGGERSHAQHQPLTDEIYHGGHDVYRQFGPCSPKLSRQRASLFVFWSWRCGAQDDLERLESFPWDISPALILWIWFSCSTE